MIELSKSEREQAFATMFDYQSRSSVDSFPRLGNLVSTWKMDGKDAAADRGSIDRGARWSKKEGRSAQSARFP